MTHKLKTSLRGRLGWSALGLSGLLLAGLIVPSVADHHGGGGPRGVRMGDRLEAFDTDGDGQVARSEADATVQDRVERYDADGSGSLSVEEYEGLWLEMRRQRMIRAFQRLDKNADGQVTAAEAGAPVDMLFDRLDKNADGIITDEEVKEAAKERRERRRERAGRGPRGGHGPE